VLLKKIKKSNLTHKIIARIIWVYDCILHLTCKFEFSVDPLTQQLLSQGSPCIFAAWHSRIFIYPKLGYKKYGRFTALVSHHRDGEFLVEFLKLYGHLTIRGSSRRNSFNALKQVLETLEASQSHLFITPDGPIGPRFQINGNITTFATKFNLPIIPATYSAFNAIVLNTWDKFIIPLPFTKIIVDVRAPIYYTDNDKGSQDHLKQILFEQMLEVDKKTKLKVSY
jgi:lysophospholipid acyltransferase (LPLAT)-like uncharacterized protein